MHVRVLSTFRAVIFFGGQPYQPVIVNEHAQRVDDGCNENVDSKIEFVPLQQRWLPYILLNNVGIVEIVILLFLLSYFNNLTVCVLLERKLSMALLGFFRFFLFYVFMSFLLLNLKSAIKTVLQLFNSSSNEYSPTLRSCLWLDYKNNRRLCSALLGSHDTRCNILCPLFALSFVIWENFMKIWWVNPSLREKIVLIWHLFLKSL